MKIVETKNKVIANCHKCNITIEIKSIKDIMVGSRTWSHSSETVYLFHYSCPKCGLTKMLDTESMSRKMMHKAINRYKKKKEKTR